LRAVGAVYSVRGEFVAALCRQAYSQPAPQRSANKNQRYLISGSSSLKRYEGVEEDRFIFVQMFKDTIANTVWLP
jgi:hypothetical protein